MVKLTYSVLLASCALLVDVCKAAPVTTTPLSATTTPEPFQASPTPEPSQASPTPEPSQASPTPEPSQASQTPQPSDATPASSLTVVINSSTYTYPAYPTPTTVASCTNTGCAEGYECQSGFCQPIGKPATCGGFLGVICPEGHFCLTGEGIADAFGTCIPIPHIPQIPAIPLPTSFLPAACGEGKPPCGPSEYCFVPFWNPSAGGWCTKRWPNPFEYTSGSSNPTPIPAPPPPPPQAPTGGELAAALAAALESIPTPTPTLLPDIFDPFTSMLIPSETLLPAPTSTPTTVTPAPADGGILEFAPDPTQPSVDIPATTPTPTESGTIFSRLFRRHGDGGDEPGHGDHDHDHDGVPDGIHEEPMPMPMPPMPMPPLPNTLLPTPSTIAPTLLPTPSEAGTISKSDSESYWPSAVPTLTPIESAPTPAVTFSAEDFPTINPGAFPTVGF